VNVPSTTVARPDETTVDEATGEWSEIAGSPLSPRRYPAVAWTGTELLVWGGLGGLRDGAAYDPQTSTWRMLAEPPPTAFVGVKSDSVAALFTDHELLVVTGELHVGHAAAAAYSPVVDSWRTIATPPFDVREGMFTAWTGREAIFYGGVAGDTLPDQTGYAYEPATDDWREIPNSPLGYRAGAGVAWTGTELVVIGGSAQKTSAEPYNPQRDGAAYDPAAGTWRMLPPNPFGDTQGVAYAAGPYVVVPDQRCDDECSSAAVLGVATGSWTDLPATAEVNIVGVSLGGAVLRWGTSEGWAYVPSTGGLHQLAPPPIELQAPGQRVTVATADRVLVLDERSAWEFRFPLEIVDAALGEQRREQARQAAEAAATAQRQHAEAAAMEAARLLSQAGHVRDPETFEALPLADSVAVYRGAELLGTRRATELRGVDGWTFATASGDVALLDGLRESDWQNIGPKTVSPCLLSSPDPAGTEGLMRVTVRRGDAPSCAEWWAYDVYVNDTGEIAVVRLDG
jgi:hypothetical protein